MSMEISGSYSNSKTNYAEQMKEKQALDRAKKAEEAKRKQDDAASDKVSEPHDEYISSEKSGVKPSGLYRIGQDENGNRKVFFENPNKLNSGDEKKPAEKKEDSLKKEKDSRQPKVNADNSEKPEKCIGNTDKVEKEIRKLKEKKKQLEQQIRAAFGDEKKVKELENKLAQVESELSQKDNDTYRRQNTSFSKI